MGTFRHCRTGRHRCRGDWLGSPGGGASGAAIAVPAVLLFGSTAAWPSFLPPRQEVYKGILAAGTGLGAAALAIGLWG